MTNVLSLKESREEIIFPETWYCFDSILGKGLYDVFPESYILGIYHNSEIYIKK